MLFTSYKMGPFTLPNRLVYAPLTRWRHAGYQYPGLCLLGLETREGALAPIGQLGIITGCGARSPLISVVACTSWRWHQQAHAC